MPLTTKRTSRSASSTSRTSETSARRTGQAARRGTARKSTSAARRRTGAASKSTSAAESAKATDNIKVTIPLDEIASAAVDVATVPVRIARRVLPAKGGLPVYAGIGVLAVAEVIEWPVAVAAGVGYAVLRRWGPRSVRSVLSGRPPEESTAGAKA